MNILLWVAQIFLAFLMVSGGGYKLAKYETIVQQMEPLGRAATSAIGVLEIVCGLLLIVPAFVGKSSRLIAMSAAVLVVESLALSALYARHSTAFVAENPLVWTLLAAVLAIFVAAMRWKKSAA